MTGSPARTDAAEKGTLTGCDEDRADVFGVFTGFVFAIVFAGAVFAGAAFVATAVVLALVAGAFTALVFSAVVLTVAAAFVVVFAAAVPLVVVLAVFLHNFESNFLAFLLRPTQ